MPVQRDRGWKVSWKLQAWPTGLCAEAGPSLALVAILSLPSAGEAASDSEQCSGLGIRNHTQQNFAQLTRWHTAKGLGVSHGDLDSEALGRGCSYILSSLLSTGPVGARHRSMLWPVSTIREYWGEEVLRGGKQMGSPTLPCCFCLWSPLSAPWVFDLEDQGELSWRGLERTVWPFTNHFSSFLFEFHFLYCGAQMLALIFPKGF